MEKVSIQRDGLRGDGLHDAFTVRGKGGGEGFVLQAEGLTISREVPLVFCPIDDQP